MADPGPLQIPALLQLLIASRPDLGVSRVPGIRDRCSKPCCLRSYEGKGSVPSFWELGNLCLELTIKRRHLGTSLVVQWLRLHTPNAGGLGSIPGQGTRSHMLQLSVRILQPKIGDPMCYT